MKLKLEKKMTSKISEIGAQSPEELFTDAVNLHGDFIKDVNQISNEFKWESILKPIRDEIELDPTRFIGVTITQYKSLINKVCKAGLNNRNKAVLEFLDQHREYMRSQKTVASKTFLLPDETPQKCGTCMKDKPRKEFRKVKGGGLSQQCRDCFGKSISNARKKNREAAEKLKGDAVRDKIKSEFSKELEELRLKNQGLEDKLRECQDSSFQNEEEYLEVKIGKALYFLSAIIKDPETNEMDHVTDQIQADSEEEAVGTFILKEGIKGQIIISIGYEASIHNQNS